MPENDGNRLKEMLDARQAPGAVNFYKGPQELQHVLKEGEAPVEFHRRNQYRRFLKDRNIIEADGVKDWNREFPKPARDPAAIRREIQRTLADAKLRGQIRP